MVHVQRAEQNDPCTESQLRRAYFAHAGELAMRYNVVFDRVLRHLAETRACHPRLERRAIACVEDLVHAIACVDGVDLAWLDLVDQYERPLIRACRQWLDDTDAIVFVRRLLARVRHDPEGQVASLASFDGTCSLRRWLGDRLIGGLTRSDSRLGGPPRPGHPWQPVILWRDRAETDFSWRDASG